MTNPAALVAGSDADVPWRNWQARGAAADRRTTRRMRALVAVAAAALIVWFVVQIA